jgi:hypothetical protein
MLEGLSDLAVLCRTELSSPDWKRCCDGSTGPVRSLGVDLFPGVMLVGTHASKTVTRGRGYLRDGFQPDNGKECN